MLHAPLELLARYRLLPFVQAQFKPLARLQIVRLAAQYAQTGEPVAAAPAGGDLEVADLAAALLRAIDQGAPDEAQALAARLSERADAPQLARALGQTFLTRLGAAAHAHIFLYLLTRLEPQAAPVAAPMLAGLARALANQSGQRLSWTHPDLADPPSGDASGDVDFEALERALLSSPLHPFSGGIYPIMHSAEGHKAPQRVIAPAFKPGAVSRAAAERGFAAICKVAALTMIEEEPPQAKYGWTHCLTLPQAVWEIADYTPDHAFALKVAATYVTGMRAAIGRRPRLVAVPDVEGVGPPLVQALTVSPQVAAAAAWRAPAEQTPQAFGEMATQASIRSDAHLVKYTLACWDCARRDPASAAVYRAGAAFLGALWIKDQPVGEVERSLGVSIPQGARS